MKVLHVIPSLSASRGGPSVAVLAMTRELTAAGIEVHIATTNDNGEQELNVNCDEWTTIDDIKVRYFRRWSPPIRALREFSASVDFNSWFSANAQTYDLIHVHAIFSGISSYAMWHARKAKVPYIVRTIGQLESWSLKQSPFRKQLFLKSFEHASLRAACVLHCTSKSEAQAIRRFDPKLATTVVPLGIKDVHHTGDFAATKEQGRRSFRASLALKDDTPIVLFLSRLHPKKGLEHLLEAMATNAECRLAHLVIAGDGEDHYVASIQNKVKRLSLRERCHFLGFVTGKEKHNALLAADLFCLPSSNENFGISVLEALNAGCAAVVSSEVALATDIQQFDLGAVIDINGLSTELGPILARELSAPQKLKSKGMRARAHAASHYSWSAIAEQLKQVYQSVLLR